MCFHSSVGWTRRRRRLVPIFGSPSLCCPGLSVWTRLLAWGTMLPVGFLRGKKDYMRVIG